MKIKRILAGLLLLGTFVVQLSTTHAQGTAFTYQGRLNSGTNPATGTYDLTFSLFDTNIGGIALPVLPQSATATLSNGLFAVTLDFGLDPTAFNGNARWLEIGVRTNGGGAFTTLNPRQKITPTPYAIYAASANTASTAASATGFAGSLAGDVTGPQSATVAATVGGQTAANVATGVSAANAATSASTPNTIVKRDGSGNFSAGSITLGGNLTLSNAPIIFAGTSPWLSWDGDSLYMGQSAGNGTQSGSGVYNIGIGYAALHKLTFGYHNTGIGFGALWNNTSGGDNTALGYLAGSSITTGTNNIDIGNSGLASDTNIIRIGSSQTATYIAGTVNASGFNGTFTGNGSGLTNFSANVALRTGGNAFTGNQTVMSGSVSIGSTLQAGPLYVNNLSGSASNSQTALFAAPNIGPNSSHIQYGATGDWYIRSSTNAGKVVLQDTGGKVGIGTSNPGYTLDVFGDVGVSGSLYVTGPVQGNSSAADGSGYAVAGYGSRIGTVGTASIGVYGSSFNNWAGYFSAGNQLGCRIEGPVSGVGAGLDLVTSGTGGKGWEILATGTGAAQGGGKLNIRDLATGVDAFFISSDDHVNVKVLTILGGADVAEPFQMATKEIPKGAVVVIDDENAGQLKLSDRAYDTRVAGIVSGANGINPGIALHQDGALEGGQNVALSGRVYVLADASNSPIKPGDLLTTSSTPGHAMKVTNHAKAQGAIIGKAMSTLKEGKGMVLVLVTLQ